MNKGEKKESRGEERARRREEKRKDKNATVVGTVKEKRGG